MVPLDLAQVHAQIIAQLTELGFAGVLQAELKSCKRTKKMQKQIRKKPHV